MADTKLIDKGLASDPEFSLEVGQGYSPVAGNGEAGHVYITTNRRLTVGVASVFLFAVALLFAGRMTGTVEHREHHSPTPGIGFDAALIEEKSISSPSTSPCGTFCEDNGYEPDSCGCGVCGSHGECSENWSCGHNEKHGWQVLERRGHRLMRCPHDVDGGSGTNLAGGDDGKTTRICGDWCSANGHLPDACGCGVCGSFGGCTSSCHAEGSKALDDLRRKGHALVQCPARSESRCGTYCKDRFLPDDKCGCGICGSHGGCGDSCKVPFTSAARNMMAKGHVLEKCPNLCSSFTCPSNMNMIVDADVVYGDDKETCCEETCRAFTCPQHFAKVDDSDKIRGHSPEVCCKPVCSGYRCPQHKHNVANAGSVLGSDEATCCEKVCSGFECPAMYILIEDAGSKKGDDLQTCCVEACSGYTCPTHMHLKVGADRIVGRDADSCCSKACSGFTCPPGLLKVRYASTVVGDDVEKCCVESCATFKGSCGSDSHPVLYAHTVPGNDADSCCDSACSTYECPENKVHVLNPETVRGYDDSTCCRQACGGFQCPSHKFLVVGAGHVPGATEEECCDHACSAFVDCPMGTVLIANAANVRGGDSQTCCQSACSSFECAVHTNHIVNAFRVAGSDQTTCCEKVCSGYVCQGQDLTLINDALTVKGSDDDKCCTEACSGFVCPGHKKLVEGAADVRGNDEATCCAKVVRPIRDVVAGMYHVCALFAEADEAFGYVKCWGHNGYGQLGLGDTTSRGRSAGQLGENLPYIDFGQKVQKLSTGRYSTYVILEDGSAKCVGECRQGGLSHLGDTKGDMESLPTIDLNGTVREIMGGVQQTCAITTSSHIKCYGYSSYGETGQGTGWIGHAEGQMGAALPIVELPGYPRGLSISASDYGYTTCAVFDEGDLKCWGYNGYGNLGLGDTTSRTGPFDKKPLPSIDVGGKVEKVFAGPYRVCALLQTGGLKCWGWNGYGQLGQGNTVQYGDAAVETPADLPVIDLGGKNATEVAQGYYHTCALLEDGAVKCWGHIGYCQAGRDQAGQGNIGDQPGEMGNALPAVDLGGKAKAITAGYTFTCALLEDDSVKCWGLDSNGALGVVGQNYVGCSSSGTLKTMKDVPAITLQ